MISHCSNICSDDHWSFVCSYRRWCCCCVLTSCSVTLCLWEVRPEVNNSSEEHLSVTHQLLVSLLLISWLQLILKPRPLTHQHPVTNKSKCHIRAASIDLFYCSHIEMESQVKSGVINRMDPGSVPFSVSDAQSSTLTVWPKCNTAFFSVYCFWPMAVQKTFQNKRLQKD